MHCAVLLYIMLILLKICSINDAYCSFILYGLHTLVLSVLYGLHSNNIYIVQTMRIGYRYCVCIVYIILNVTFNSI
jgi:hypothetical protein